jgi:hypothetical protein
MESITWFGHWLWFHWFVRQDGAWMIRVNVPGCRPKIVQSGIELPFARQHRIAGYFYELGTTNAFVALFKIPGQTRPLRHVLAYAPPSERFKRWVLALAG